MAMLELRAVAKQYPGGVPALSAIDLEIDARERVAIVGPSGSGKPTLLPVMGTLERASSGQVLGTSGCPSNQLTKSAPPNEPGRSIPGMSRSRSFSAPVVNTIAS